MCCRVDVFQVLDVRDSGRRNVVWRGVNQGECTAVGHRSDTSFRLILSVVVTMGRSVVVVGQYDSGAVGVLMDSLGRSRGC